MHHKHPVPWLIAFIVSLNSWTYASTLVAIGIGSVIFYGIYWQHGHRPWSLYIMKTVCWLWQQELFWLMLWFWQPFNGNGCDFSMITFLTLLYRHKWLTWRVFLVLVSFDDIDLGYESWSTKQDFVVDRVVQKNDYKQIFLWTVEEWITTLVKTRG